MPVCETSYALDAGHLHLNRPTDQLSSRTPLAILTATVAPMPRPPVYPPHSRAILLTSAPPFHLRRNCHPPGLPTLCVCASKAFDAPYMRSPRKSIRFKHLRTLFLSCRSFPHSFPLFSMVCGLFCKIPGGGGIQTVLEHHSGSYDGLSRRGSTGRWFKTGGRRGRRCRRRRLCR